jgi:hypothetical protein
MTENEGDFVEEERESEIYEELVKAIEWACGVPGRPTIATFAAAVIGDPATGQMQVKSAFWPQDRTKYVEIRRLIRAEWDRADEAGQA